MASIFERFGWILGGKLGSKIEQKSIPKGIEKVMKKRRSTWGVLGASSAISRPARSQGRSSAWPRLPPNIFEERNLTDLYRSPASGPRHAAGLLRARCGYPTRSKAAYPPPRLRRKLSFGGPGIENIEFWRSRSRISRK